MPDILVIVMEVEKPAVVPQLEIGKQPNLDLGLGTELYRQKVSGEKFNLRAVIAAVNGDGIAPQRKQRSDAGVSKKPQAA